MKFVFVSSCRAKWGENYFIKRKLLINCIFNGKKVILETSDNENPSGLWISYNLRDNKIVLRFYCLFYLCGICTEKLNPSRYLVKSMRT